MNQTTKKPRIIAALDVEDRPSALELVKALSGRIDYFKVGSRLFTALGPPFIEEIRKEGAEVFLDLKFHDIPATVAGAVRVVCGLGVSMMTIHTTGGYEMMKAAAQEAQRYAGEGSGGKPVLVGVTVLTSLTRDDLGLIGPVKGDLNDVVLRLSEKAREAGLDGVVCSAREAAGIRSAMGEGFVIVTPGIRPSGSAAGDQKRVVTPAMAVEAGADFLVIGRPIYQAPSPVKAAEAILGELEGR